MRVILILSLMLHSYEILGSDEGDSMMRKSIIFDKKTPDVFYCPLAKHDGMDEMVVKARALSKLCEYNGKGVPKGQKSDCYNDADETEYACKEKKRILKKLNPPGMEILEKYQPVTREKKAELYNLEQGKKLE